MINQLAQYLATRIHDESNESCVEPRQLHEAQGRIDAYVEVLQKIHSLKQENGKDE